jgi:serine/threonine protein kinase
MDLTVPNLYGLLLRSRLLPLDDAKAMFARWQEEAKEGAGDLAGFSAWLVSNKYLTEYQASLLAKGHADDFFLNEYVILERLGKGRMAGVYKARHKLGQVVAIKVLPPSKAQEANLLARFHREARLALRLQHPNIVRAFQTGVVNGLHYLVMEYLEGETLEEVLQRRDRLKPAEAVRLIYQALQGLQHIHTQGLIHRDLKPANLMLVGSTPESTARATVKILDIGLGRTLFEEGTADPALDPGLTGEGVILGTPDYMSPEQGKDPRHADIRSDVYSLGCVLYHLLTGQPPFPDKNVLSQMVRHATEEPRPLCDFDPQAPDGLEQILGWMLAKDPARRYPTPERAAQALQVYLSAGDEPAAGVDSDPQMRPFLSWLEAEDSRNAAVAPPASSRTSGAQPTQSGMKLPAAVVLVSPHAGALPAAPNGPSGTMPSRPTHDGRRRRKKSRKADRLGDGPPTVPFPPPSPPIEEPVPEEPVRIDVVPVSLPEAPLAGRSFLGRRLTRRDVVLFGMGALAGSVVTFLGCLIGVKRIKSREAPPENSAR